MIIWPRRFYWVTAMGAMLFGAAVAHADHVPDEILIKWENSPVVSTWTIPGAGMVISRIKKLGNSGWELWKLPRHQKVESVMPYVAMQVEANKQRAAVSRPDPVNIFGAEGGIISYAINGRRYPLGRVPNDPLVSSQKHLDVIQAFGGWDFEIGSSSPTTIAIIDTGVDISHVDLSSASGKIWTNPLDLPGGGDEDGNGRIDDLWGWDFGDNDNNPSDCLGHGTLVASAASAVTDNGIGVAGVSWNSKVLPLKIFSTPGGCGEAFTSDIVAAIDYAVWVSTRHSSYTGRLVINMSLGCPGSGACGSICSESQAEKDAVNRALANNVLVIAAKGNCGNSLPVIPSDYPGVFAVGATTSKDTLASFSSYGSGTDMVAPGVDILGAAKGGGFGNSNDDGTSFSAPLVAGAAALALAALPSATTAQLENILTGGADDLGSSGRDDLYGYGRLNLFKSMRLARYGTLGNYDGAEKAIAIPNPFRLGTSNRAMLTIPIHLAGSNTKVKIYDTAGTLIREMESTSWDGKNDQGIAVVSGVYVFEVKTDLGSARGRVIVDAAQ